jgi:hypothetical protein
MPVNDKTTEISEFVGNALHLDFPRAEEIEAAYTDLPARGRALLTCRLSDMANVLKCLEKAGFFGLQIRMPGGAGDAARISAFKGKEGPCYDTGRTARYKGSAVAALDDDNHLLSGQYRVCEKTATVYSSPAYARVVDVSEPSPELLARLRDDPVVFNCDTFQADVERLAASFAKADAAGEPEVPVLYPGPFKLLVLRDGTVLRRGAGTLVRKAVAKDLVDQDGCVLLAGVQAAKAVHPQNFAEKYREEGAMFLLGDMPLDSTFRHVQEVNMAALRTAPQTMIDRLKKMIEREDKYFIMTGSDPRDEFGCCPSDHVGAANRLVEAGVLHSWHPPAVPASCPSTIYAFRGEIHPEAGKPSFIINEEFRRYVADHLVKPADRLKTALVGLARWVLMAFVGLTLGLVLIGKGGGKPGGTEDLAPDFNFPKGKAVLVCFFHGTEKCDGCRRLEVLTRKVLDTRFQAEMLQRQLLYHDIATDAPRNRDLVSKYAAPNIIVQVSLASVKDGKIVERKYLDRAYDLAYENKEAEFAQYLESELRRFLEGTE